MKVMHWAMAGCMLGAVGFVQAAQRSKELGLNKGQVRRLGWCVVV